MIFWGLKRISTGVLALVLILSQVQVFEAFEAHVINVTAKIVQPCDQGSTLSGYKFYDRNGNGTQDSGEEGLPDWLIELEKIFDDRYDYNTDSQLDGNDIAILQDVADEIISCPGNKICDLNRDGWVDNLDVTDLTNLINNLPLDLGNQMTASDGHYAFNPDILEPGTYVISEVLQDGWTPTTPTPYTFVLACGANVINFGNIHGSGPVCGDGILDSGEQCDDGNLISGDGCSSTCQTENNECGALSIGYYQNHDGCPAGSIWTTQINDLSSDTLQGAFASITDAEICTLLAPSNCPSGGTVEGQLCRAQGKALADLSNIVAGRLNLNALIAGGDDGNIAFDHLGLSATSTIEMALDAVETIILDPGHTKDQLAEAAYVAERLYSFYEDENPIRPTCIYPGCGNGYQETGEQCDDGNLISGDSCSATCELECSNNDYNDQPGYWADYFNHTPDGTEFQGPITDLTPGHTPFEYNWYNDEFFSFSRIDSNLKFGGNFFPVNEGKEGDPYHFAVRWRGLITVGLTANYKYTVTTDDDAWILIDGMITTDLGGVHAPVTRTRTVNLKAGQHIIEIYYAERHTSRSHFYFDWLTDGILVTPLPAQCSNVLLNEFVPNPIGNDLEKDGLAGEWAELYNKSDKEINLDNWKIKDYAGNTITINSSNTYAGSSTIIGPRGSGGEWLVVLFNQAILNNNGDGLFLYNADNELVDAYIYPTSYEHDTANDPGNTPDGENQMDGNTLGEDGKSWARIPDGFGPWFDPIPTPGAPNILDEPVTPLPPAPTPVEESSDSEDNSANQSANDSTGDSTNPESTTEEPPLNLADEPTEEPEVEDGDEIEVITQENLTPDLLPNEPVLAPEEVTLEETPTITNDEPELISDPDPEPQITNELTTTE